MPKYLKITFVAIALIIIITMIMSRNTYKKIYNDYFRLSEEEVLSLIEGEVSGCKKIIDCNLLPGDILIRKYITERTQTFSEFLDPYFIHAAIYMGNDEYFEAVGLVQPKEDQVKIMKFSTSDWLYEDVGKFVVIRPKKYEDDLETILERFREIADDPEYVFGLPKEGKKETTCADVIVKELQRNNILPKKTTEPKIISPDYLFLLTISDKENFEIVGYN